MKETLALLLLLALIACSRAETRPNAATSAGQVDANRLSKADADPGQWFTNGRDAGGTYFSPLSQVNEQTIGKLGFAWQYALGTSRGLQASPIVVDGRMFAVGNFGRVYALNAATGRSLWTFVPTIDMHYARYACCDVVNRGIAVWKGRVYVAALDGFLYSLDANTGRVIWKVDTLIGRDQHVPYSVTGAPVVTRDAVVIGNGGADFPGVRGYISAYDLTAGEFKWRFFTVPRDPKLGPQDQPHLVAALKTWDARHQWEAGGGGTVWDGLNYDPETDLVFLGTSNVSPYNTRADGRTGGDALYGASTIAVNASTGALAWYQQETPDDRWDFDSTQKFILTTLSIRGVQRKVVIHAPKNGFLYVYDRATGEILTATPFAFVNWTKGLDPVTHKPIPNPAADYDKSLALVWPSAVGAHSWQPMSYSPITGLVYIPVIEAPNVMIDLAERPAKTSDGWFTVQGIMPDDYDPAELVDLFGKLPTYQSLAGSSVSHAKPHGTLSAWDPVSGKRVWEVPSATIWDGGVMSTAGNLVFRGDAHGLLNVYTANAGRSLKSLDVGTSIMAAPITYSVDGEQYVAIMAGLGGGSGFLYEPSTAAYKYGNAGRIVALKLGGGNIPKPNELPETPFERPVAERSPSDEILQGEILYNRHCGRCHVFGRGLMPDLRRISAATYSNFYNIVLRGAYLPLGMAPFDDLLSEREASQIRAYLVDESWKAYTSNGSHPINQGH